MHSVRTLGSNTETLPAPTAVGQFASAPQCEPQTRAHGSAPGHRPHTAPPERSGPTHHDHPARCARPPLRTGRERTMGRIAGPRASGGEVVPESLPATCGAFFRILLEVLDHRRQWSHLHGRLTTQVAEMVLSLAPRKAPGQHLGTAAVARVHARLVTENVAESVCTYSRGQRVFAMAARFEQRPGTAAWVCTSLLII
jgi:hypothetical protein